MTLNASDRNESVSLVPPQLPPFLANVFNLKPIVGNPSREEVKLIHEALFKAPELRDTDLSAELSQHLFDVQMACHQQKYPINILPNEIVYDPPTLPNYIPVELNPITGPPSNKEIALVHTALRMSDSFANVPSIFDADLHAQLSQHLFDIQLARHVQRSIVKRSTSVIAPPQDDAVRPRDHGDTNPGSHAGARTPLDSTQEATERTGALPAAPEQPSHPNEATDYQNSNDSSEACRANELMVEIRDTLKNMNRVLVGSQNSLARGFNSSRYHNNSHGSMSYDLGAHSLINDRGEVPETYSLPTFKNTGTATATSLSVQKLTENELARYLQFYGIGEEMTVEEEELKIKSGMVDDAKRLLSGRLWLDRR